MFEEVFDRYNWNQVLDSIYSKTADDVNTALRKSKRNLEDFKALISPAALDFLEPMAQLSRQLTLKRFGKTMQLYIPLYLSNECHNICTYCGFSLDVQIKRKTLSPIEIMQEAAYIKQRAFDHVL